jgi:hypothetical protein
MNDKTVGGIHWSFWIISVVTLIFNVMGVINYFVQMNPDMLASFPESYRPIIEGRPAWATAAFAIAVFGGSLGCLLYNLILQTIINPAISRYQKTAKVPPKAYFFNFRGREEW